LPVPKLALDRRTGVLRSLLKPRPRLDAEANCLGAFGCGDWEVRFWGREGWRFAGEAERGREL